MQACLAHLPSLAHVSHVWCILLLLLFFFSRNFLKGKSTSWYLSSWNLYSGYKGCGPCGSGLLIESYSCMPVQWFVFPFFFLFGKRDSFSLTHLWSGQCSCIWCLVDAFLNHISQRGSRDCPWFTAMASFSKD